MKPRRQADPLQCKATHNPRVWPYVARCAKAAQHGGKHRDPQGLRWKSLPLDEDD